MCYIQVLTEVYKNHSNSLCADCRLTGVYWGISGVILSDIVYTLTTHLTRGQRSNQAL